MPVPRLEDTVAKYLRSVQPFLDEHERAETERKAKALLEAGGAGQKLHMLLLERAKAKENWVSALEAAVLVCRHHNSQDILM